MIRVFRNLFTFKWVKMSKRKPTTGDKNPPSKPTKNKYQLFYNAKHDFPCTKKLMNYLLCDMKKCTNKQNIIIPNNPPMR